MAEKGGVPEGIEATTYNKPHQQAVNLVREKNGVVYTKAWVVDLILDLVGYAPERPLSQMVLVEPSAGDGSFLLRATQRLLASAQAHDIPVAELRSAIVAYEIDDASASSARLSVRSLLCSRGVSSGDAELLADSWVRVGDYLLDSHGLLGKADFIVGNPPYIRLEDLDAGGAKYRSKFSTMVGRADIYVAFFEAALSHLRPGAACGFICADRWMFNQYGAELRRLITSRYSVETVVQMHHADAFESDVSAYPAITVLRNAPQGSVVVATLDPNAEAMGSKELVSEFRLNGRGRTNAARIDRWFSGSEPWPLMEPAKLALLRRLEAEFATLEASGALVGIGVATGADKVFITTDAELVEPDRLLPLAMAFDIKGETVNWSGNYLVNPWNGKGLVDLRDYPKLAAYFERHREQLESRHVGKKAPANWYRTIDKVADRLTKRHKLYLPDFKGRIAPVLDRGETYPHHNLYFIEPGLWDAEVLGGLLLSNVAQFFIEAYGVRMRGGYLRFQAQYLRRLCVPRHFELSHAQEEKLRTAFHTHDIDAVNDVAVELYGLTNEERGLLGY